MHNLLALAVDDYKQARRSKLAQSPEPQAVTGKSREEITLEVQDMSWGAFKPLLADATVAHLVSHGASLVDCSAAQHLRY